MKANKFAKTMLLAFSITGVLLGGAVGAHAATAGTNSQPIAQTSVVSAAQGAWKPVYSSMLGKPYKHKVIKYSPTGWGDFEGGDRKAYFSSDKHIQYRYIKKSRTMIYRYNNHDKALRSKYNYQKIVLRHGHKTPEYSYYYKLGKQKWVYTVTYKFWLVKPVKY